MRRFRRGLATLLCISMTGAMFPVPVSAEGIVSAHDITAESAGQLALFDAETGVTYLAYNEESKEMEEKTCNSVKEVTSADTIWGTTDQESWYVAKGDITIENRVTVQGTVHLILADNCKLEIAKENGDSYVGGIAVSGTDGLFIHAQSEGDTQGKLICKNTGGGCATIGGESENVNGAITIDGGNITSEAYYNGAGIGGAESASDGTSGKITINGGTINATGNGHGAGIGGGGYAGEITVTITGGEINATGSYLGAGIGGGSYGKGNATVNITGGEINAIGKGDGAAIGSGYLCGDGIVGIVTISGGKINATGNYGAGIGSGKDTRGEVTISGGEINATGNYGAGIGGGEGATAFGSGITITGGVIKAASNMGSGIGPGKCNNFVGKPTLTIENSPFIFASSSDGMKKGIYKQDDSDSWTNIISMDGSDGRIYGNVTTAMDFEITGGQTLSVPEGTTLTVGEGKTITNKGTIKVAGEMDSASADEVTGNQPKYRLLTNGKLDGVTEEETTIWSDKIYYFAYKDRAVIYADPETYENKGLIGWSVNGANVPIQRTSPLAFTMPANVVAAIAEYGDKAPTPDLNGKVKVGAETIEISGIEGMVNYGKLEFVTDSSGGSWESESNGIFTGLTPDTEYTIHVRYAGKGSYAASDAAEITVKTKKWADITEAEKVDGLTATYGQSLNEVDLPEGWTWKDSSVKLNSLGTADYEARFAPADADEVDYSKVKGYVVEDDTVYLDTSLEVTVTQAEPVVRWAKEKDTYIYTGRAVEAGELPNLSVTLKNDESYSGTFTYFYREKKDSGEAGDFITGLPKEPGVYEVKAAVSASGNYTAAESDVMTLYIQYLENTPNAVTTDRNGSEYTEWFPARFDIEAPENYSISDKAEGTYSDSFTYRAVSKEEQQEITYYLKNDAGQIAKKTLTAKIDQTAPDWNGANIGINIKKHWWNFLLEAYDSVIFKGDSLDVKVKANDSQSGVVRYGYYVSSGDKLITIEELDERAGVGFFTKVPVTGNGEAEKLTTLFADATSTGQLVYVYAEDAMGNRSSYICSNGVIFDNEKPTLHILSEEEKVTVTDISAKIWVQCTEQGDYYYSCRKAGEPAPASIDDFADKTADVSKDADTEVDTWEAKDGVVTGKILSSEYAQQLEITGLTSNTDYVLYMVAADEAGNASDVAALNFRTVKTVPYIETAPKLVGEYGQSLADMGVDDTDAKVVDRKGIETTVSGNWSVKEEEKASIPEIETTETYTLVFTPTGENADRYETASCEVIPEVAKKTVTVVIADKEKVYEQNNPEFTWDFAAGSGLVAGDSNADLGITLDSVAEADSPGGKYAIIGSCNSKKYDVNFTGNGADGTSGVLTITQAANEFTAVLSCAGYTYGKNKKPAPAISAKYGTVLYRYAHIGADGSIPADAVYTDTIPVNAGTYAVKAYVEETSSYAALESDPVTFVIAKADAPVITGEEQSYVYAAGSEGETSAVEIAEKLPADKGDAVYSCDTADTEGILSEAEVDGNGKLTFQVNAVDDSKIGKTATIKVKAVMQNYEDAEYTLTVQITDKKSVELQNGCSVAVEGDSTLTYGQKLSSLNLTEAVFVEAGTNTVVEGTLVWSEPEKMPAVGTIQADWVFRPARNRVYKEMTGTIAITVVKAPNVPTSTPSSTPTSTPSSTPVSTSSSTPTIAPSSTPASTPSSAPTIAPSSTPAGTPSSTPTIAPSSTPAGTPSSTPSSTPASTPSSTPESTSDILKKGAKFTAADGAVYKVISTRKSNPTVMYYAAEKNAKGKVRVPATVKYNGVTYKVVSIRAKAFANRRKLQKVIIGKNVTSIGRKAFYNCRKLKKVIIKTTKLTKKRVGSAAFKKTAKNIVFKLPAKNYKAYKKVLKKKGVSRKAVYKKNKK